MDLKVVESGAPNLMGLDAVLGAEILEFRLHQELLVRDLTLVHQVGHRGRGPLTSPGTQLKLLQLYECWG